MAIALGLCNKTFYYLQNHILNGVIMRFLMSSCPKGYHNHYFVLVRHVRLLKWEGVD